MSPADRPSANIGRPQGCAGASGLPPQAVIGVFERGGDGLLTAACPHDGFEVPVVRS